MSHKTIVLFFVPSQQNSSTRRCIERTDKEETIAFISNDVRRRINLQIPAKGLELIRIKGSWPSCRRKKTGSR